MTAQPANAEFNRALVEDYIRTQTQLDVLRFITCGSVDDGKSTLIGRLLYESHMVFDDQLAELEASSKKHGTQGGDLDLALLVDGLAAEREQGITIDVAYRYFNTDKRRFIVADTPGHEQYTRNMVTGASTADAAVLLIDARLGVLTQTRRHATIAALLGVTHLVLAVNKMDLVDWDQTVFHSIVSTFSQFCAERAYDQAFASITAIPISALTGDNVVRRSHAAPWFQGPALLQCLEELPVQHAVHQQADTAAVFRLPVQWVNRPSLDFRGYSGLIEAGSVAVGDAVRVAGSGLEAEVAAVYVGHKGQKSAVAGTSVTITLDRPLDVSRGDVLVNSAAEVALSDQIVADLVWLGDAPSTPGANLSLKLASVSVGATITRIASRLDINTGEALHATALNANDISTVSIQLDRPIFAEPFATTRALGAFILIDRHTNTTVAAGLVRQVSRRALSASNRTATIVDQAARERLNGHPAKLVWLQSTSPDQALAVARALEMRLHRQGKRTIVLTEEQNVASIRVLLAAGLIVIAAVNTKTAPEGAVLIGVNADHSVDEAVAVILSSVSFDAEDATLFHL
jgi:bifunctional enzyme CysN/CysC